MHKGEINYAHQSFVTTPSRSNELLVQGHARDLQAENQSLRHSAVLWAVHVVTNDLYIRRCKAQPNDMTPVNISDE